MPENHELHPNNEIGNADIVKFEQQFFVRKVPQEYNPLIVESDPIISVSTEFSDRLFKQKLPHEAFEIIRNKIKGETVLDARMRQNTTCRQVICEG